MMAPPQTHECVFVQTLAVGEMGIISSYHLSVSSSTFQGQKNVTDGVKCLSVMTVHEE